MQNKKFRNECGITLVALIITIIILIILVAVSINAVLSSNFINLATQGTINYAEAQSDEQKKMDDLDSHLKDVITKVQEYAVSGSGTNPAVPTNPPVTPPNSGLVVDSVNDLGKYINYTPTGGNYTALSTYSGYPKDQIFSTETDIKSKIFKVENDTLYLISDRATQEGGVNDEGILWLGSYDGYNNGVKLLNDLCSACYTDSSYSGMSARSLNIRDIEDVTTFDYKNYSYGASTYGKTKTFSGGTFHYPNIWNSYEKSEPIENRNSQTQWFTGKGGLSTTSYTLNYWSNNYLEINADSEWLNKKYYELLFSPLNDLMSMGMTWLSSRYVRDGSFTYFGLMQMASYYCDGFDLCNSSGSAPATTARRIRPLLEIPLSSCLITESEASNSYNISPK